MSTAETKKTKKDIQKGSKSAERGNARSIRCSVGQRVSGGRQKMKRRRIGLASSSGSFFFAAAGSELINLTPPHAKSVLLASRVARRTKNTKNDRSAAWSRAQEEFLEHRQHVCLFGVSGASYCNVAGGPRPVMIMTPLARVVAAMSTMVLVVMLGPVRFGWW